MQNKYFAFCLRSKIVSSDVTLVAVPLLLFQRKY